MGFRHFYYFNLAMLGKQDWRLLTNQYTIASRILRARYFPKCELLGVHLGHNPSFIFGCSIHGSQVIVRG
jgi:hypothetical protein